MLVYGLPSGATNLWTRDALISIREYENAIKRDPGYK